MKPTIQIPHVRNFDDNTGITTSGGWSYAGYTEDGVRKRVKLGQTATDDRWNRIERDKFYATLLRKGATVATRGPYKRDDPDKGIRRRKPWMLVLKNKLVGEFDTWEEARAAKRKHEGGKP